MGTHAAIGFNCLEAPTGKVLGWIGEHDIDSEDAAVIVVATMKHVLARSEPVALNAARHHRTVTQQSPMLTIDMCGGCEQLGADLGQRVSKEAGGRQVARLPRARTSRSRA